MRTFQDFVKEKAEPVDEAKKNGMSEEKTKEVIAALAKNDFVELEDQMKGIQLLKGIAVTDNAIANKFMAKLSDAYTAIAEELGIEV